MQQGEYGTTIDFTSGLDMTNTTLFEVRLTAPGQPTTVRELNADAITDRAAGRFTYVIHLGELDRLGTYRIQAIDISPGRFVPSLIGEFVVRPNSPAQIRVRTTTMEASLA